MPDESIMHRAVVIGTGPSGLTAAIYLARANVKPLVIEGPDPGGQLTMTTEVENFPGFPDGVDGTELIGRMRQQAERFGARFVRGQVRSVDFSARPYRLSVEGIGEVTAESVILSTGASAKLLGILGERENLGRGVSTCATCDGFFYRGKHVVVIGGGDSAMEEAVFLTRFASEVTVVHRRDELRASKIMQERARNHPRIRWKLDYSPLEVLSGDSGVTGLRASRNATNEEEVIAAQGIFVAIGHRPNTAFLGGAVQTDEQGYIRVRQGSSLTNIPGVFACGDVQDSRYRQAITAAGSGCMAAMDCERYLEELHAPVHTA